MTRIMPYKKQNQFEGHMKVMAEGGGILAHLFLFSGAWKVRLILIVILISNWTRAVYSGTWG